jgi:PleD family two-component response regulator
MAREGFSRAMPSGEPRAADRGYDAAMILCAVDDLMFSSKLRHAAGRAGVELRFVKSPEALLADAREHRPALVVVDLNADRLRPLDMIAALRADADLAGIRTACYVSHVDTARITAARAAGAGDVMARSAFVDELPRLFESAR